MTKHLLSVRNLSGTAMNAGGVPEVNVTAFLRKTSFSCINMKHSKEGSLSQFYHKLRLNKLKIKNQSASCKRYTQGTNKVLGPPFFWAKKEMRNTVSSDSNTYKLSGMSRTLISWEWCPVNYSLWVSFHGFKSCYPPCMRSVVSDFVTPVDCSPPGSATHGDFSGKNTGGRLLPFSTHGLRDWTHASCVSWTGR